MSGETEEKQSAWTTDTLREYMMRQVQDARAMSQQQIDDLRVMLQERYETQTKAVDAAFAAQQIAMSTALTAAERAVATALLSAEKAVTKAEVAAEKRFEAVNEFRGQLNDIVNTLISRTEADARMTAIAEKLDNETARLNQRLTEHSQRVGELDARLSSRLDLHTGAQKGVSSAAAIGVTAVGVIATVLSIIAILSRAFGT